MAWLPSALFLPLALSVVQAPMPASDETPTSRHLTAMSLDGRYRVTIKTIRPVFGCDSSGEGSTDNAEHELILTDTATGDQRPLFLGGTDNPDPDPRYDTALFGDPRFSLDGKGVYIVVRDTICEIETWRDVPRVYRVPMQGRTARFIADGRLIGIIRNGRFAGDLLVEQRSTVGPAARDPIVLLRPDGARILVIPGSEQRGRAAVQPWLNAQGSTAY